MWSIMKCLLVITLTLVQLSRNGCWNGWNFKSIIMTIFPWFFKIRIQCPDLNCHFQEPIFEPDFTTILGGMFIFGVLYQFCRGALKSPKEVQNSNESHFTNFFFSFTKCLKFNMSYLFAKGCKVQLYPLSNRSTAASNLAWVCWSNSASGKSSRSSSKQ